MLHVTEKIRPNM